MPTALRAVSLAAVAAALVAAPAVVHAAAPRIDVEAEARLLDDTATTEIRQTGTFHGDPLGSGRIDGRAEVTGRDSARMTVALRGSKGFLRATGKVAVRVDGTRMSYTGTARVTSVDGAARGLKGRVLRLKGSGDLVDNRFSVDISG